VSLSLSSCDPAVKSGDQRRGAWASTAALSSTISMADVLKYTREDLKTLVYHPIRPLDVVSEEIGIPVDQVLSPLL